MKWFVLLVAGCCPGCMVVERKVSFENSSVVVRGEIDPFAPHTALISAEYRLNITRF